MQSDELLDHIKFDHGYTISSPPIVNVSTDPLVAFNCIAFFFSPLLIYVYIYLKIIISCWRSWKSLIWVSKEHSCSLWLGHLGFQPGVWPLSTLNWQSSGRSEINIFITSDVILLMRRLNCPIFLVLEQHCMKGIDAELPSVMTCANYLKLPPYSSKVHPILFSAWFSIP